MISNERFIPFALGYNLVYSLSSIWSIFLAQGCSISFIFLFLRDEYTLPTRFYCTFNPLIFEHPQHFNFNRLSGICKTQCLPFSTWNYSQGLRLSHEIPADKQNSPYFLMPEFRVSICSSFLWYFNRCVDRQSSQLCFLSFTLFFPNFSLDGISGIITFPG